MAEVEAWLFYCWTPGRHCVFASVDKEDKSWWPTDDWKVVTRRPLIVGGPSETLHGHIGDLPAPARFANDAGAKPLSAMSTCCPNCGDWLPKQEAYDKFRGQMNAKHQCYCGTTKTADQHG